MRARGANLAKKEASRSQGSRSRRLEEDKLSTTDTAHQEDTTSREPDVSLDEEVTQQTSGAPCSESESSYGGETQLRKSQYAVTDGLQTQEYRSTHTDWGGLQATEGEHPMKGEEGRPGTAWDGLSVPAAFANDLGLLAHNAVIPEGRVVGVYFDKQRRIWRANWREGGVGRRKTKNFSVDDYGFEEARRLAIQYRLLKIMEASDKQMGCSAGSEQTMWLSQELKRKSERKSEPSSAKGKKRRRYSLNAGGLLRQPKWTMGDDEVGENVMEVYPQVENLTGFDMSNPGGFESYYYPPVPAWGSPWDGGVVPMQFQFDPYVGDPAAWTGGSPQSPRSKLDLGDVAHGIPADCGRLVVSSIPADADSLFGKMSDLVTTADTGSGDEVDDSCGGRVRDDILRWCRLQEDATGDKEDVPEGPAVRDVYRYSGANAFSKARAVV